MLENGSVGNQEFLAPKLQKIQSQDSGIPSPQSPELSSMVYVDTPLRSLPRSERAQYIPGPLELNDYKGPVLEFAGKVGLNIGSYLSTSSFAIAGAFIGTEINPLAHVDTKYAIATLLLTYGAWARSMYINGKENWRLLENTGLCGSVTATASYDFAKRHTDKKILQQISMGVGYSAVSVLEEIPWYTTAFIVQFPDILAKISPVATENNKISYLTFANLGAAVGNMIQSVGYREANERLEGQETTVISRTRGRLKKIIRKN